MTRNWLSLIPCALLAACAQAPVATTPALPAIGEQLLQMNPEGGHYTQLAKAVAEGAELDMDIEIVATHPDPKWAPLAALCVEVPDSPLSTCVRLIVPSDRPQAMMAFKTVREGEKYLEQLRLDGTFKVGERIPVRLRFVADGLVVTLGQEAPVTIPLEGTAAKMNILCSSALCRFALR